MSDSLYRLRLADGTTWAIVARDLGEARAKADVYFPNERTMIEVSREGEPWRTVDAGCQKCGSRDVMPDLGGACDVSCGGASE